MASPLSARPVLRSSTFLDAAALVLLSLAVNLIHLGSLSITFDEATSVSYAHVSRATLLETLVGRDPNQGVYYVFLRGWVRLFGEGEAAVRLPSAVFGALAVGAVYVLGRHLFGRTAGVIAAILLALNAFVVQYAQTARAYALLLLLVTVSSLFFARERESPSRGNRIFYVVSSALAVYAHYFGALILVVHLLTLLAWQRRAVLSRPWPATLTALAVALLPAAAILSRTDAGNRLSWIPRPNLSSIAIVFTDFAGGSRLILSVLLIAGFSATFVAWRQRRAWPLAFIATWLFLPVVLSFLVSLAKPAFLAHYLIICVPALVLFGATGLASLRPRATLYALVVVLVIASAAQLRAYYAAAAPQDWRAASRYILGSMQPEDAVLYFTDSSHKPVEYYARQLATRPPANRTGRSLENRNRVWFVIRTSDLADQADLFPRQQASLRERLRLSERREFGFVAVELYVR